jgi:hypothetical protein
LGEFGVDVGEGADVVPLIAGLLDEFGVNVGEGGDDVVCGVCGVWVGDKAPNLRFMEKIQ